MLRCKNALLDGSEFLGAFCFSANTGFVCLRRFADCFFLVCKTASLIKVHSQNIPKYETQVVVRTFRTPFAMLQRIPRSQKRKVAFVYFSAFSGDRLINLTALACVHERSLARFLVIVQILPKRTQTTVS